MVRRRDGRAALASTRRKSRWIQRQRRFFEGRYRPNPTPWQASRRAIRLYGRTGFAPRLFTDEKIEPFSLNRLYDRALAHNRLFGVVHDGDWYHVGTPEDLAIAETALNKPKSGSP